MQSPITNFARVLNQIAEKNGEGQRLRQRLNRILDLQTENAWRDLFQAA